MLVSISKVASALGVSIQTLYRWDKAGIICPFRTAGGHRRYDMQAIRVFEETGSYQPTMDEPTGVGAIYARVSSQSHKEDLARQRTFLEERVIQDHLTPRVYSDIGSGLNDTRPGLLRLLRDGLDGKYDRVYVTYADRLARFGTNAFIEILSHCGIPVTAVHVPENRSFEAMLADDIVAIITSFAGKVHRRRRGQNDIIKDGES